MGEPTIPRQLLRELLQESIAPKELHAELLLQGNCLAASTQGQQVLVFHPSGAYGEQITLSVLQLGDDSSPWHVRGTHEHMGRWVNVRGGACSA